MNQSLFNHFVEWRSDLVDGDAWVRHTENTIEFGSDERNARLPDSFAERLAVDLNASNVQRVDRLDTAQLSCSISDGEFLSVSNVRRRRATVVLVVEFYFYMNTSIVMSEQSNSDHQTQVYVLHATFPLAQLTEGTHRLEDPVSKMTVKFCGGVPKLIGPKYWACI